ncbi:MAG: hypothetical protein IPM29_22985 [Planctomycetes bacterium]|nr:hypothetical protein [Planctomycetota bacterium]
MPRSSPLRSFALVPLLLAPLLAQNRPPQVVDPARDLRVQAYYGQDLRIPVQAVDPDGDPLTMTFSEDPPTPGLQAVPDPSNPGRAVLTWNPVDIARDVEVTVTVSDGVNPPVLRRIRIVAFRYHPFGPFASITNLELGRQPPGGVRTVIDIDLPRDVVLYKGQQTVVDFTITGTFRNQPLGFDTFYLIRHVDNQVAQQFDVAPANWPNGGEGQIRIRVPVRCDNDCNVVSAGAPTIDLRIGTGNWQPLAVTGIATPRSFGRSPAEIGLRFANVDLDFQEPADWQLRKPYTVRVRCKRPHPPVLPAGAPAPDPAWGGSHVLDVEAAAAAALGWTPNGILGVAQTPNGHWFVSSRRNTALPGSPHFLLEFDPAGVFVAAHTAPAATLGSAWGFRDLAWDQRADPGSRLYMGAENSLTGNRVFAFDWHNGVFDPGRDVVLQSPTNATTRALAYLPTGLDGVGPPALVTGDWSSPPTWFDVASGALLFTGPSLGQSVYGVAYDPDTQSLWWSHQRGSSHPANPGTAFTQTDLLGNPTGQRLIGDLAGTSSDLAGGCEIVSGPNGEATLVYLNQGVPDAIVRLHGRFEAGPPCGGRLRYLGEPFAGNPAFQLAIDGAPFGAPLASLWVGFPAATPFSAPVLTCDLLLDPVTGFGALTAPLQQGSALLPVPIPLAMAGVDITMQAVVPTAGLTAIMPTNAGRLWFTP